MEEKEFKKRKFFMEYINSREENPVGESIHASMSAADKDKYISILERDVEQYRQMLRESLENQKKIQDRLDSVAAMLEKSDKEKSTLHDTINRLMAQLEDNQKQIQSLQNQIQNLINQSMVDKANLYGKKVWNNRGGNTIVSRQEAKDDFDGTAASLPPATSVEEPNKEDLKEVDNQCKVGMKYNTMGADMVIDYKCDETKIPDGAKIIRRFTRSIYDQVSYIVEHKVHYIVYKLPGQDPITVHFTLPGNDKIEEDYKKLSVVPHTHVTSRFLSRLTMNKYQMDTPLYREIIRMMEDKFSICRQTLTNYIGIGAEYLKQVLPYLKNNLLQDGANIHCDETWCRVRIYNKVLKKYIWCVVNKETKVVYFFYDNGSRGQDVIKNFIGSSNINSIQTDSYCGYSFFDREDNDITHLYCLAHARAKFFYAYERGKDHRAKDFLDWFGWLYGREETYRKQNISPAEIKKRRNDSETTECIVKIYSRMCELQMEDSSKGELMTKALNYLSNGWKQFFTFRENGRYEIDNLEAERSIRPLTVNRKNAPILGSESGVENLCLYMTFVETCKKNNISPLRYFERFFDVIAKTNGVGVEWEQMTPGKLCSES